MLHRVSAIIALCLMLGACGNTPEDRAITGAGLGAAGGAMLGAVTGLSVLQGAIIGTGIGGVTGLLTDKSNIDIGDPIWKTWFGGSSESSRSGGSSASGGQGASASYSQRVADTQSALADLGYATGSVDGVLGPKTRAAIRQYQSDHSLLVDGRPSSELLAHMRAKVRSG